MSLPGLILPPGLVASGGGGVPPGYQYLGTRVISTTSSTSGPRTNTAPISFGPPDPSRILVAAISFGAVVTNPVMTVSTLHIGPFSVSPVAHASTMSANSGSPSQAGSAFGILSEGNLLEGTLGYTSPPIGSTQLAGAHISLYALYGFAATPFDAKSMAGPQNPTQFSGNVSVSLNVPANGLVLVQTTKSTDSTANLANNDDSYVGPTTTDYFITNGNGTGRRPRVVRNASEIRPSAQAGYIASLTNRGSNQTSQRSISGVTFQRAA